MNNKKRLGLCLAAVMIFSNVAGLMSMPAFADDVTNSTVTDMMELIPATGSTSGEDSTETPEGETTLPTENNEGEATPPAENSEGEATPPAENNEGETVPPTENKDDVIPMIPLQDIAKAVEVQDAKAESNGMNKSDWNIVSESGDEIVLGEYIGQSSDVMIPSEMDGKQVYIEKFPGAAGLKASQGECNNLNKITSVTTVSVNGGKVKPFSTTWGNSYDNRPVFGMPWTSNSDTLTSVDLSAYDISGYDTLQGMFRNRRNLTTIKGLDKWDTSNITELSNMFLGTPFTDLEQLKNWNVSRVTAIKSMFSEDTTNIDALSNWDVSNVEDASELFAWCGKIEDFSPISNWELGKNAKRLDLNQMFVESSMEFVDLSKWNINSNTDTTNMFKCNSEKPLLVVTDNEVIKNYDFAASNRIGVQMTFKVDGQETAKSDAYLTISSADSASIKEIWEKETAKIAIPLKKDMIFDRWEAETPIKNAYDALSATYNAVFKPLNTTEPTEPTEPSKPDGSSKPDSSSRPEESHRPNDVSRPEESSKPETSVKPSKKPAGQESDKTDKTENTSAQTETVVSDNSSKPNPDTGDMGSLNMLSAMLAASSGTFAILLSKKKNHKK